MKPHEFISGYTKVTERFGQWPSFHDGEIHRVVLDRMQKDASGSYVPVVEILLRGWTSPFESANDASCEQQQDSVVHLRFEDVFDLELDGLNHQNVLFGLELELFEDSETKASALSISLEHCYGLAGHFRARKAQVI